MSILRWNLQAKRRIVAVGTRTFELLEDPCGGLISWSAEAVT
jgi:hypothetical protein